MEIKEFQKQIEKIYFERDHKRGIAKNFMWFTEEVGELSRAILKNDRKNMEEEFADVFAWLSTLASGLNIEMEEVVKKYADGCPRCKKIPCKC